MSRTDSWAGLSPRGLALVEGVRGREVAKHEGMCNLLPLLSYRLPDGRVLAERVQTSVWASGPTWFATLATESGDPLEAADWSAQEIADEMGLSHGGCEPSITAHDAELFADLEESILAGRTHLYWGDERKFHRWLAGARGASMAQALAALSPEARALLTLLRWRLRHLGEVREDPALAVPGAAERAISHLQELGWLQTPRAVGAADTILLELTHDGSAAATLLPRAVDE